MSQCKRCLIDTRYGVELDSAGICSYCKITDEFSEVINKIGKQEDLLKHRLGMFKNYGDYDCIVGLSGGKDSSYIVYSLKKRYNARVLTFTCDNGFLTEFAKNNINSIVKDFGVDHIWVSPDKDYRSALIASNLKKECWPCSACVHMGESAIWKLAFEKKIPFIVSGRTPEQILRRPTRELFESDLSVIVDNYSDYDPERVRRIAQSVLKRFEQEREWLLPKYKNGGFEEFSLYLDKDYHITDDFTPEYLAFFLYEMHDELGMMEMLERETNWRNPRKMGLLSHLDCAAHDAAGHLFYQRFSVPFAGLETSALIRHGHIDMEQGKDILNREMVNNSKYPKDSIMALSEISGCPQLVISMLPKWIGLRKGMKDVIRKIFQMGV